LGAHAPALTTEDVNLIHDLWLDVTQEAGLNDLHHKEIITAALGQLAADLKGKGRTEALERMKKLAAQHNGKG
jgi:hypothetical protein